MRDHAKILIISQEGDNRRKIRATAESSGLRVTCCQRLAEATCLLAKQNFSLVFCSDELPDGQVSDVIQALDPTPVVVMSRVAEWQPYLASLRRGAFDYIACPPDSAETARIIRSAFAQSYDEEPNAELAIAHKAAVAGA